jgi:histone H3/H4
MTKSFDDLASAAKTAWSDDARRVYEAASAQFTEELAERADLDAQSAAARKTVESLSPSSPS